MFTKPSRIEFLGGFFCITKTVPLGESFHCMRTRLFYILQYYYVTSGHYFREDGVHLSVAGAQFVTQLIADSVKAL